METCLAHVTGCAVGSGGCVGDAVVNVSKFVGCFAGPTEMECIGFKGQEKCATEAGIDNKALQACVDDKDLYKSLMKANHKASRKIVSVPTLNLNGRTETSDPESKSELDKAFCDAGATAAC